MNTTTVLKEKLKQIHDVLNENYSNKEHIGVLAGMSGISLFHFYYARFVEDEQVADVGVEVISETIKRMNEGYSFPTFCTGIAGAGWVLELLNQEEFVDIDSDELLSELDNFLFESMEADIRDENFDFLHGAIGYGYYFLKRYQNTKSQSLKEKYTKYLLDLINALKNSAQENDKGVFWMVDLRKKENLRGANLSLSHGMASIINFLSRLYVYDDFQDKTKDLLVGATDFIINCKYSDKNHSSLFPSWVHPEMEKYTNSRLAWCYGDLGIGVSLWRAGKALEKMEYKELAIDILKHSAKRRDAKEAGIIDTGLCHGMFGVVSMFYHMYLETNELLFRETADFWMEEALKRDTYKDGHAGYMQWRGDKEAWQNETNLLEGIAGIGLSMISYLTASENQWNECLMIS